MEKSWVQARPSALMSNVNFGTENKLLKKLKYSEESILSSINLRNHSLLRHSTLSNLPNTENQMLKRHECSQNVSSKKGVAIRQVRPSVSSDEPEKKKIKDEIVTELGRHSFKEDVEDYVFDWPVIAEKEIPLKSSTTTDLQVQENLLHKRLKESLMNAVSISLIQGPNLKDSKDPFRSVILERCKMVTDFDPEFILKLALYTRQELNIRTTTSLLLAFATIEPKCRRYLKRYFKSCIVLPTDWIAVAEQFQYISEKSVKPGFLPAALRKVLVEKFSDFDVYQLAKHNKGKRRNGNVHKRILEAGKNMQQFTLKRMVGLLHIRDPADYVMGILGKKYPDSRDSFTQSRLPGVWEESRAGKRMSLPIPVTWETELSSKGNKKKTWEDLIDAKKLPYMAMLRNLRNLILAGISMKHHGIITGLIKDKKAVIKSRQFPYRFYTALDILEDLQNVMFGDVESEMPTKVKGHRRTNGSNYAIERKKKLMRAKIKKAQGHCSKNLFSQYKNALNEAIQIAAFHNIPPISGRTLIFLDVGDQMNVPCLAAKSLGKPMEISKLARIMTDICSQICERCEINEFSVKTNEYDRLELTLSVTEKEMLEITREKQKVDTVIFITNDEKELLYVTEWVRHHRVEANPRLVYVHLALSAAKSKAVFDDALENDIKLVGYTDAIFRFISERSGGNRMDYIDNIDKKYNLDPLPVQVMELSRPFMSASPQLSWKTVKVFIASTFLDMQSERDLLVRHIFPELRRRAKAFCMDVYEVDLRWGITASDEASVSVSELCLEEVMNCHLFIGLLGGRYGAVPDRSQFRWANPILKQYLDGYPKDASITEMEFYTGALAKPSEHTGRAFFYFRDNDFVENVPEKCRNYFEEHNLLRQQRLTELKQKVRASGLEVYDGYSCSWGGLSYDGLPRLLELERFGQRVLDNVWNALLKMREIDSPEEVQSDVDAQETFAERYHNNFIGYEKMVNSALKTLSETQQGLVLLVGKRGSGKTSIMAHLYNLIKKKWSNRCVALPLFTGASNSITDLTSVINYLMEQFSRIVNIEDLSTKNKGVQVCYDAVAKVVKNCGKLYMLIDGMDAITKEEKLNSIAEWLHFDWPKGAVIICSCTADNVLYKKLRNSSCSSVQIIAVGKMSLQDRSKFIRDKLAEHGKKLDETFFNNQLKNLTLKRDSDLPLYLSLACEELRAFGQYEMFSDKVRLLKNSLDGLLEDSILSLEQEFGLKYVAATFAYLTVSVTGFTDQELYFLLGYVDIIEWPSVDDIKSLHLKCNVQLPLATFTLFVRALRNLIQPTETTLNLTASASIATLVKSRYKNSFLSPKCRSQVHRILAGHLWEDCYLYGDWMGGSARALVSLPYHLVGGDCQAELKEILCDFNYIRARFSTGSGFQLLEDYKLAVDVVFHSGRLNELRRKEVGEYQEFIKSHWMVFNSDPEMIVQQAVNEQHEGFISAAVARMVESKSNNLMKRKNRSKLNYKTELIISSNTLCVSLSPDEQMIAFGDGTVVQLYDLATGCKLKSFVGHSAIVTCLLFVGQHRLCSGSADGTISVWNVEQGHRLLVLKKHARRVTSIILDATGRSLISSGWDGEVYIWRLSDGFMVSTLDWNNKWSAINCIASHPQKPMFVTGSWDAKLRIWCLQTLKRKALLHGHTTAIVAVAVSPCGTFMASSSIDCKIKLWSCSLGFQLATIDHGVTAKCLFFQTKKEVDSCSLVAGCSNGATQIYSCEIGQPAGKVNATAYKAALTCLLINTDNLVAGYEDGSLKSMKCSKGYKLEKSQIYQLGESSITCLRKQRVADNIVLIVGSSDGIIKVLDENFNCTLTIIGHKSAITAITSSKKSIVSGDKEGIIGIINKPWKNDTPLYIRHLPRAHMGSITSISFNVNNTYLASTGNDQTLKIWNWSSIMKSVNNDEDIFNSDMVVNGCHGDLVTASCWVEKNNDAEDNSSIVITAGKDLRVKAWDPNSGELLWKKSEFNAPVNQLFSARMIVCGFALDGSIYVWESTGVLICEVAGRGECIAAAFFDLMEEHYEWYEMVMQESCERFRTKTQQYQAVADDLAFLYVAKCNSNGLVSIVKPCFNTKPRDVVLCHRQDVVSIACGKGNKFATSSLDGTVRVWSLNSPSDEDAKLHVKHMSEICCMALMKKNDDSVLVITGDRNGYLMTWADENDTWTLLTRTRIYKKSVTSLVILGNLKSTIYIATISDNMKYWALRPLTNVEKLPKSDQVLSDVTEYKLTFLDQGYFESSLYTCIDFYPKTKFLSVGFTDDSVRSSYMEFNVNSKSQWDNVERDYSNLNNNTEYSLLEFKIWTLHLKLICDDKMDFMLTFTVNSLSELWVSTYQKINCHNLDKKSYGETFKIRDDSTEFSENVLETYPTSMDICLLEFTNEFAYLHQFIGMANGFLLSLRLKYDFNEKSIEVIHHTTIKMHQGSLRGLSCLRMKSKEVLSKEILVFTGGDDGIMRDSRLDIDGIVFKKRDHKFLCEGPVTCLKTVQRDKSEIFIGCADTLGNTYAISTRVNVKY